MKKKLSTWLVQPYKRVLLLALVFMLPATLIRIALLWSYPADFRVLGLSQILHSFGIGLRFDLSMTLLFIGIPLLLMLLPFRWCHHRYWQRGLGALIYLAWLFFIVLMVIDTVYFGYVHRHTGSEINTLSSDMGSMMGSVLSQYRFSLVTFILFAGGSGWLWWQLLKPIPAPPQKPGLRLLLLPGIFIVFVLAGRGGYSSKPISVGDAFFSDSIAQGYLALNGAFAISRTWDEKSPPVRAFMTQTEATKMTQHFVATPDSHFPMAEFPLFQQANSSRKSTHPNVVVLMLESWGALHIDTLRREMKLPPLGVTPNFDKLAQQGRLYTHFYANGQRSIQGAAAILASQPTFPSMPLLGLGMEQNRLSFIGQLAQTQHYQTIFLQSSDRGSFHFNTIASRAGFSRYLGAEDIPNLHEQPKPASTWGTWDHNTFQQANSLFAQANKPFLGFIFTSTTHIPWIIPDQRWNKYSGGTDRDAFLNTLFYADWALGQLVDAAKQAGYFDNTIFVITADHANEFTEQTETIPNQFHIPLLLVGPGVTAGIDQRIGSQFDILPTVIDLAGWSTAYAGMGRSLLDESRQSERASLSIRGDILDWITDDGWLSHNLERRVGSSAELTKPQSDLMEHRLLGVYQTTIQAQVNNRFLPTAE